MSGDQITGVLISGRGSNLAALLNAGKEGRLRRAKIAVVISNRPEAKGLQIARDHGIPAIVIDHRDFAGNRTGHDSAIAECLRQHNVEWVILAGYMRVFGSDFIRQFENRIINIHPSLLPAFPGVNAQKQAVEYGARISGCTVHFVNEEMDAGPIILQRAVTVYPEDSAETLAGRIIVQEHKALTAAVDLATHNRLVIAGRQVLILEGESSSKQTEERLRYAFPPLLLATGNDHKVQEIGEIIQETPATLITTRQFRNIEAPEETGGTFEENALIKARAWHEATGLWTLADDSGLVVDALDGRPGIHSARYRPTNEERIAGILDELKDTPESQRNARFVCVCALVGPNGEEYTTQGVCEGAISFEPAGAGGFGYDPIFLPEGFHGQTLAELSAEVKNNISHRARALFALKPHLQALNKSRS